MAKVFKMNGLLPQDKPSSSYWPADFTEEKGLLLRKGAHLGRERVVILNRHLRHNY